jgi:hypothetical protein
MHDVDSKTLNRTFATVVFSQGLVSDQAAAKVLSSHKGMIADTTGDEKPELIAGRVVETMNGGGYTYVAVERDGSKKWVAIPESAVKTGQDAAFLPGMTMRNFKSKALGRTFESIVFSDGIAPVKAETQQPLPQTALRTVINGKQEFSLEEITGKVAEIVDTGDYSYIAVDKDKALIWVATPKITVAVGDQVAFQPGEVKRNYRSKKLDRTLPTLVFSRGLISK